MYKIVARKQLSPQIFLMDIEAPRVAKSALPGQFIIIKMDEKGEIIPLTICDYDTEKGTVTIVVQAIGCSTTRMMDLKEGDYITDFVGPLGQASEFVHEEMEVLKNKKILFVAGGLGTAPVYPQVKWLHEHGVQVDVIIGAKTKELVILEEEMKAIAENVYVATDDGSYGFKGLVTNLIEELVTKQGKKYDEVVAIGPMIMMKFVCLTTEKLGIKTIISLNPIMVDGTGMCGACRVTVDGVTKFACVDGPEFDGHKVDFNEAMRRSSMYREEEQEQTEVLKSGCRLGGTK